MKSQFTVTYSIVTPESAEHGDDAEHGFAAPGGWHFAIETCGSIEDNGLTLREAVGMMGCVEDCGRWFVETDGREDYKTGAVTTYSLHPPRNITESSYRRLARLLGA